MKTGKKNKREWKEKNELDGEIIKTEKKRPKEWKLFLFFLIKVRKRLKQGHSFWFREKNELTSVCI